MSSLAYRRIAMEDLKGSPPWISTVINPLNLFFEQSTSLVNGNLSIGDNVSGQITQATFITPTNYSTGGFPQVSFSFTGKAAPKVCSIGKIQQIKPIGTILTAQSVQWSFSNSTNPPHINIEYIAGLIPATTYTVTFLVL